MGPRLSESVSSISLDIRRARAQRSVLTDLPPLTLSHAEELDGLDKENILDNETGVQTRGVDSDPYKQEKEVDAAVDAAVDGDEGQKQ